MHEMSSHESLVNESRIKATIYSGFTTNQRERKKGDFIVENLRANRNSHIEPRCMNNSRLTYNGALDSLAELKR